MMNENLEAARALWGSSNAKIGDVEWIAPFAFEYQTLQVGSGNFASEGYDLMTGDVQAGYHTLFEKLDWFVSVTQEFGTYPSPFVVRLCFQTDNLNSCSTNHYSTQTGN